MGMDIIRVDAEKDYLKIKNYLNNNESLQMKRRINNFVTYLDSKNTGFGIIQQKINYTHNPFWIVAIVDLNNNHISLKEEIKKNITKIIN